jgi:2-iminoacetate synthase ThiH
VTGNGSQLILDSDAVLKNRLAATGLDALMAQARALRDAGHGLVQSYSPKVFIPLTKLCRDYCHYCTFSRDPQRNEQPYLSRDEVLAIAREGAAQGCTEALFTLGDKPEARHRIIPPPSPISLICVRRCWPRRACCRM